MKYALATLVLLGIGAFGWWTLSPLFIDRTVNDAPPLPAHEEGARHINEAGAAETTTRGPFPVVGTPLHPASGEVRIIKTPEVTIVRYENYEGTNGPDLFVYLANDLEANDFVNLGRAQGNRGNINYTVPAGVVIDDYRYVMVWCRAFSELFDYAHLRP